MAHDRDRAAPASGPRRGQGEDCALLEALLEVFAQLELDDQLRRLGAVMAKWTGAACVRVIGVVAETRRLGLVGSAPRTDEEPVDDTAVTFDLDPVVRELGRGGEIVGPQLPASLHGLPVHAGTAEVWTVAVRDPGGRVAGVLVFLFSAVPDEPARERARRLLERARPAVANGLAVGAIRELVFKDDTADCFNRRYFNEFLGEELSRASRFGASLSLIFFDMDNLKEVNSRLGHAAGSSAIFEVSQRVRAKIRRFDKLFRFGGDEFCIVLPETEWHGALEVAERVRESIAGRPLLTDKTDGEGVKMTASFGIASFPLHARNRQELIHLADWAMQRIKRGTKNSIAIAEIARPERP